MQVTVFDPDLDWSRPHEFLLVDAGIEREPYGLTIVGALPSGHASR